MKYTTKRSKVEEVVIDLEDGCILKLNNNVTDISLNKVSDTIRYRDKHNLFDQYWDCHITLDNGLSYYFKTRDEVLVQDLTQLCGKGY